MGWCDNRTLGQPAGLSVRLLNVQETMGLLVWQRSCIGCRFGSIDTTYPLAGDSTESLSCHTNRPMALVDIQQYPGRAERPPDAAPQHPNVPDLFADTHLKPPTGGFSVSYRA